MKKPAIIGLFGEYYGNKLINLLNTCCSAPAISITFAATCAGLNPSGNTQYDVSASATYNTSIAGYTTLIGYFSNQPFTNWSAVTNDTLNNLNLNTATIVVNNITAGTPIVSANLVANKGLTPGTYYALVTDNRSNYSNYLTVNIPDCGYGNPSGNTSTPAQASKSPTG